MKCSSLHHYFIVHGYLNITFTFYFSFIVGSLPFFFKEKSFFPLIFLVYLVKMKWRGQNETKFRIKKSSSLYLTKFRIKKSPCLCLHLVLYFYILYWNLWQEDVGMRKYIYVMVTLEARNLIILYEISMILNNWMEEWFLEI